MATKESKAVKARVRLLDNSGTTLFIAGAVLGVPSKTPVEKTPVTKTATKNSQGTHASLGTVTYRFAAEQHSEWDARIVIIVTPSFSDSVSADPMQARVELIFNTSNLDIDGSQNAIKVTQLRRDAITSTLGATWGFTIADVQTLESRLTNSCECLSESRLPR